MVDRGVMRFAVLALLALSVAACRSNPGCFGPDECSTGLSCIDGECLDPALADVNWQQDIQPIVVRRCVMCHGAAPMDGRTRLLTYNDVQNVATTGLPLYEEMAVRVASTTRPMPPAGQVQLTAEEIAKVEAWASRGAPQGPMSSCDGGSCGTDGGGGSMGPLTGAEVATLLNPGYALADGPVWNAQAQAVLFTDTRQGRLFQTMLPASPMEVLMLEGGPAGLAVDAQANLIAALSTDRSIARIMATGPMTITRTYDGVPLNGPQDVVRRSDGAIYFTDPGFNTDPGALEIDFDGLYRIPNGMTAPIAEWEGLRSFEPAGLAFSAAETQLFMTDRLDGIIRSFDVAGDGALSNERVIAESPSGAPQGLTVDTMDNLYVASAAGIEVFAPTGTYYGVILTPDAATNVAFVGLDLRTMVVTTANAVYVVQNAPVPGAR